MSPCPHDLKSAYPIRFLVTDTTLTFDVYELVLNEYYIALIGKIFWLYLVLFINYHGDLRYVSSVLGLQFMC